MIPDIISAIFLILLCYLVNKVNEELEIKRLIKEGKKMETETIVEVNYEIIKTWR